jgi:hypothetical protein
MWRSDLWHRLACPPFMFGYRNPLSRAAEGSMGAESEIPQDPDLAAARDPWRDGDKGGHPEGELDPRIPKIMEDVMRYIRNIDVNTL